MSELYGPGLQGELLGIVHEICEHERVFGGGIQDRTMRWRSGDLEIWPAFLTTVNDGYTIDSAVLTMDNRGMELKVVNTEQPAIPDGDRFAESFLRVFQSYLGFHATEHELCVRALQAKLTGQYATR